MLHLEQDIPRIWKIAEVLMILNPGKPPNKVDSYRPISLLPIMSKLFEKKKRRTRNEKKKSIMVDRTKVTNDNKQ
jgi:hypothetical protein